MVNEVFNNLTIKGKLEANSIGDNFKQALFDFFVPINSIIEQRPGELTPSERYGMGTWAIDISHGGRMEIGTNSDYTFGSIGGEANHTLTIEEMPNHAHSINSFAQGGNTAPSGISSQGWGSDLIYIDCGSVGGNQTHNNMSPYITINYWKRIA